MSTDERETPTVDEQPAPTTRPGESIVRFWFAAWAGTAVAGSSLGMLLGLLIGLGALAGGNPIYAIFIFCVALFVGAIWAGLYGIPVHITIAVLTWACWLQRSRLTAAIIAGGLTGISATVFITPWLAIITGPLGAIGAAAGGQLYLNRRLPPGSSGDENEKTVWQFTIRDLLLRMTVLAMLTSAWTWSFKTVGKVREQRRQESQEWEEQWRQQAEEDRLREETAAVAEPLESEGPAIRQSLKRLIDPES